LNAIAQFSTRLVPHGRRHLFWRDVVAETFPGLTLAASEGIRADLSLCAFGDVTLARVRSDHARGNRIVPDDGGARHLLLHVLHRGSMTMIDRDRSCSGRSGDIIVSDSGRPYALDISNSNDCLILQMPIGRMGDEAAAQDWHGRLLAADNPNVGLLSHVLRGLWSQRGKLEEMDADTGALLVDAARMACRRRTDPPPMPSRSPVDYALRHLDNADLGTASIGEALNLSPRAVQKFFFRHVGETPTSFITRRRLERAVAMMAPGDGQTITEIAFEVGFNDSAFFTRCFRRQYGLSPSRWRQEGRVLS
jgi:AraC-like DNA-binding protein